MLLVNTTFEHEIPSNPPNIKGGYSDKKYVFKKIKNSKIRGILYQSILKEAKITESACQCNPVPV